MERKLNLKGYLLITYFMLSLFPLGLFFQFWQESIKNNSYDGTINYVLMSFFIPIIPSLISTLVKTSNKNRFVIVLIISVGIYYLALTTYKFPYYPQCDTAVTPNPEHECGFAGAALAGTAFVLLLGFVFTPGSVFIWFKGINFLKVKFGNLHT